MDFSTNHKKLIVPVAAVMLLITSASMYILHNNGFPDRFSYIQKVAQAPIDTSLHNMLGDYVKPDNISFNKLYNLGDADTKHTSFVVIGDSHASALAPAFDKIAKELHIKGKLLSQPDSLPLFGVDEYEYYLGGIYWHKYGDLAKTKNKLLLLIKQHPHIKNIFLVARWDMYIGNPYLLLTDNIPVPKDRSVAENSLQVFRRGLDKTLNIFSKMGKNVYIVNDVPRVNYDVPQELAMKEMLNRYFKIEMTNLPAPDINKYYDNEKTIFVLFRMAQMHHNFNILNPYLALCPSYGPCNLVDNTGYPIYVDNNHLSIHGALYIASQMKSEFIKALSMPKND